MIPEMPYPKFPLTYPDTVRVGTCGGDFAADRFTVLLRIVSARHQRIAAEGGSVVSYDYCLGSKVSLPGTVRAAIAALESATESQRI